MAASSAGLSYQYARHLPLKPTSTEKSPYSWFRLPQPADTTVPPGALCWGTVGAMPSPEALPNTDFNTQKRQKHEELERESTEVRIENPDDPSQFIMVDRADYLLFLTTNELPKAGANTSAKEAGGLAAYDPAARRLFQAADTAKTTQTGSLGVTLKNGPRSL
jgi:hypothetical protein